MEAQDRGVVGLETAPVPKDLLPFVWALLERRDSAPLGMALELPDPTPLLQFVIGADYELRSPGASHFAPVPRVAVWGPTAGVCEAQAQGPVHIYCVALTHLGAAVLAQAPLRDLTDRRVDMSCTKGANADVSSPLGRAQSFFERTAVVVAWLRGAFAHAPVRDESALRLTDAIAQGHLRGSVGSIAEEAGLTVRGFHKRILHASGWGPKRLLRVARLQCAMRQIHPKPWDKPDMEDALLAFHDQAHFARDFKQLTSLTPSQYRSSKRKSGDCLINTFYTSMCLAPKTDMASNASLQRA